MAVAPQDYAALNVARLLAQFQTANQPVIQALVAAFGAQLTAAETALLELEALTIETSEGVQLDYEGELVGEPRSGRSGADYRIAIRARIVINAGSGRMEDLIFALIAGLPTSGFRLTEPAKATVIAEALAALASTPTALAAGLDAVAGAGITTYLLYSSIAETDRFAFASGDTPETDASRGWSDTGQSTGGYLVGVVA